MKDGVEILGYVESHIFLNEHATSGELKTRCATDTVLRANTLLVAFYVKITISITHPLIFWGYPHRRNATISCSTYW